MKIILLQSQEGLGNIGDIINVKDGYARNYLIPNKIASSATKENIKSLKIFVEQQSIKEAKNRENLELLTKALNKLTLKFELVARTPNNKQVVPEFPKKSFFLAVFLNEFNPLPKTRYSPLFFLNILTPKFRRDFMVHLRSSDSSTFFKCDTPIHWLAKIIPR